MKKELSLWVPEYSGRLRICEADKDESPHIAAYIGTSGIYPAFGIIYESKCREKQIGGSSKSLKYLVDRFLEQNLL